MIDTSSLKSVRQQLLVRTAAYFAAFVALGLTTASLGPTLPGLAENTGSTIGKISFLFLLRSLGYLLGSINAGRVYDKSPGNPVMAAGLIAISILLAFTPTITVLWLLAGILLLVGFAEGMIDVGGNTLLVWLHRDNVGPYMNGLHFTFGIGALLSPLIAAQAIGLTGSVRWVYWAISLLLIPIALWVWRMPNPQSQAAAANQTPEKPSRPFLVALIAIFFFLYVGGEASYGGWIYTYTISLNLGSVTSAAYLTSLFWGAITAGRLLAIPIAARLRPGVVLAIDLAGCLASLLLILALPGSTVALFIGTIGTGLCMASVFPTTLNLAQTIMPITGRTTSWFFVGASSGGMFLPWVIGQFFEPVGPKTVITAIFASLAISLLIYFLISLNTRPRLSPTPPA
jgi:FHS family Na+ dependent glucose MFS transporter 1